MTLTVTTLLSGTVCYRQLGDAMINLPAKFEVPNFARYENIKSVAKCRKWGDLGWLGVTQAYRQCHRLIKNYSLCCTVYEI